MPAKTPKQDASPRRDGADLDAISSFLSAHPEMARGVEGMIRIAKNEDGILRADEVESLVADRMRQLSLMAVECWGASASAKASASAAAAGMPRHAKKK